MTSQRNKLRDSGLRAPTSDRGAKASRPASRGMPPGVVRIVGGQWRSRRIEVMAAEGLRPTGDRVRETLFNWLGPSLAGLRCLDLFAGTGVLGLEALSRGAASMDWVERNAQAARRLRAAFDTFQGSDPVAGRGVIHHVDAMTFLGSRAGGSYDLVFLDPPFAMDPWAELLPLLAKQVVAGGRVYVEAAEKPAALNRVPAGWHIIRESRAGAVWFALLQREYSQDSDSSLMTPNP